MELTYSQQKYRSKNRDKVIREYNQRKRHKLDHDFNALAYELWRTAKSRSRKNGVEFNLEQSDVSIPELCPVLQVPMKRHTPYAPSIDRIDPSKGYVKGNIQVISRKANVMKQDATQEELILFAKWILT